MAVFHEVLSFSLRDTHRHFSGRHWAYNEVRNSIRKRLESHNEDEKVQAMIEEIKDFDGNIENIKHLEEEVGQFYSWGRCVCPNYVDQLEPNVVTAVRALIENRLNLASEEYQWPNLVQSFVEKPGHFNHPWKEPKLSEPFYVVPQPSQLPGVLYKLIADYIPDNTITNEGYVRIDCGSCYECNVDRSDDSDEENYCTACFGGECDDESHRCSRPFIGDLYSRRCGPLVKFLDGSFDEYWSQTVVSVLVTISKKHIKLHQRLDEDQYATYHSFSSYCQELLPNPLCRTKAPTSCPRSCRFKVNLINFKDPMWVFADSEVDHMTEIEEDFYATPLLSDDEGDDETRKSHYLTSFEHPVKRAKYE